MDDYFGPLPATPADIPTDLTARVRLFKRIDTELCRSNQAVKYKKDRDGRHASRVAQIWSFRERFAEWRNLDVVPPARSEGRARATPAAVAPEHGTEASPAALAPDFLAFNVTLLAIEEPFLALPAPPDE